MIVKLTTSQIETIKSMSNYWIEVSQRDNQDQIYDIAHNELSQSLLRTVKAIDVLLIVGEYVKNYKPE